MPYFRKKLDALPDILWRGGGSRLQLVSIPGRLNGACPTQIAGENGSECKNWVHSFQHRTHTNVPRQGSFTNITIAFKSMESSGRLLSNAVLLYLIRSVWCHFSLCTKGKIEALRIGRDGRNFGVELVRSRWLCNWHYRKLSGEPEPDNDSHSVVTIPLCSEGIYKQVEGPTCY